MAKIVNNFKISCPYCKEILTDQNVVKDGNTWIHENCKPVVVELKNTAKFQVPLNPPVPHELSAIGKVTALLEGLTDEEVAAMNEIDIELLECGYFENRVEDPE